MNATIGGERCGICRLHGSWLHWMQMPRGNLEGIAPRSLVLTAVADALDAHNYARAWDMCTTNRVRGSAHIILHRRFTCAAVCRSHTAGRLIICWQLFPLCLIHFLFLSACVSVRCGGCFVLCFVLPLCALLPGGPQPDSGLGMAIFFVARGRFCACGASGI